MADKCLHCSPCIFARPRGLAYKRLFDIVFRTGDLVDAKRHTAMVKSLVAPAPLSGNAPFLPENCYNYKFFWYSHIPLCCVHWTNTKKWRKPPKSDIFPHPNSTLQKWARQKSCHLIHSHVKTIVKKKCMENSPSPKPGIMAV